MASRRRGQMAGTQFVHGHRPRLVGLGAVDVGPRRAVHDRVGVELGHHGLAKGFVGHVQVRAVEREDLVRATHAGVNQILAEHPARSGDRDPHGSVISERSPTIMERVRGMLSPRVSLTFLPSRLASIRDSRSQTVQPERMIECSTSERSIVTFSSIAVYGPM